jgi:hypothetical protein
MPKGFVGAILASNYLDRVVDNFCIRIANHQLLFINLVF